MSNTHESSASAGERKRNLVHCCIQIDRNSLTRKEVTDEVDGHHQQLVAGPDPAIMERGGVTLIYQRIM